MPRIFLRDQAAARTATPAKGHICLANPLRLKVCFAVLSNPLPALLPHTHMLPVLAISLGAATGALARWGLALWLTPGGAIPWGTLAANLLGGYLIGVCIGVFQAMPQLDPVWRLLLVTGFLGGLTTFSTFSAEVVAFLLEARYGLALLTAAAHVLGSLVMTIAGLRTAMFFIAGRAQ